MLMKASAQLPQLFCTRCYLNVDGMYVSAYIALSRRGAYTYPDAAKLHFCLCRRMLSCNLIFRLAEYHCSLLVVMCTRTVVVCIPFGVDEAYSVWC